MDVNKVYLDKGRVLNTPEGEEAVYNEAFVLLKWNSFSQHRPNKSTLFTNWMVRNQSWTRLYFLTLKINSLLDEDKCTWYTLHPIWQWDITPRLLWPSCAALLGPPWLLEPCTWQLCPWLLRTRPAPGSSIPGYLGPGQHLAKAVFSGRQHRPDTHSCTKSLGKCVLHIPVFEMSRTYD